MKTKLLPTMIGAVLAAGMGAAQADITVFGHIDTSIVNHDTDEGWRSVNKNPGSIAMSVGSEYGGWYSSNEGGSSSDYDDTNFVCTTCSIGFKGSEDLGNGLSAIFYLDFQYDVFSRDTTSLLDRDQWLGLKGNFGQVRFGTISTSYKSHGSMLDPLYRTAAQGRDVGLQSYLHGGASEEGGARSEYTVRWDSPSWNGVKVTAHYTLDSDETDGVNRDGSNPKEEEDDDNYGIGVQYSNGGALVFADYLTNNGDEAGNLFGDTTAWKLGGKYTINNFAVYGQYESIEQQMATMVSGGGYKADQETTWWHVAGSYTMGNNMVYLGYGAQEFDDMDPYYSKSSMDGEALTLAGTHSLSKRTTLYAAYSTQTQDADNDVNLSKSGTSDVDKDVFAVGMKHKF